jgi:hypothetical protein
MLEKTSACLQFNCDLLLGNHANQLPVPVAVHFDAFDWRKGSSNGNLSCRGKGITTEFQLRYPELEYPKDSSQGKHNGWEQQHELCRHSSFLITEYQELWPPVQIANRALHPIA